MRVGPLPVHWQANATSLLITNVITADKLGIILGKLVDEPF